MVEDFEARGDDEGPVRPLPEAIEADAPSRRRVLRTALTAAAGGLLPGAIDLNAARTMAQEGARPAEDGPMTFERLTQVAEQRATAPYAGVPEDLPAPLAALDYDAYREIRFRPAESPKLGRLFSAQMFHRGFLHRKKVDLYIQPRQGPPRPVAYAARLFDLGPKLAGQDFPAALGFAGFRLHYAFHADRPGFQEEFAVFLGASYFRLRGRDQEYGLSTRGAAIGTGAPEGEEFPDFVAHWLCEPDAEAQALTVLSLLDSPSLSGAFRFLITPGETSRIAVTSALFPRKSLPRLGLAPLTSMFLFGQNGPGARGATPFDDIRPQVHDSDGLAVATEADRLWRPLVNGRAQSQISAFGASPLKGFGLLQRERNFAAYLDVLGRQEARPGLWVAPEGDAFADGAIQLYEIPQRAEWVDNIVAAFVPRQAAEPGRPLRPAYTLTTVGAEPAPVLPSTPARVVSTRVGSPDLTRPVEPPIPGRRLYCIDFVGPDLPKADDPSLAAEVSASHGSMVEPILERVPQIGGWRISVEWRPPQPMPAGDVVLRARLVQGGRPVSETWDAAV